MLKFRRLIAVMLTILLPLRAWCLEAPEYKIKATYIYNFAKFTDWSGVKPAARDPIQICIVGQDPFENDLDRLVVGKSVDGHPLQVRHLAVNDELKPCRILFLSRAESGHAPEILRRLPPKNVLSVGETPEFTRLGGHIQFFVKENKVGFEVNLPAVERAGLRIDARVLSIATVRR